MQKLVKRLLKMNLLIKQNKKTMKTSYQIYYLNGGIYYAQNTFSKLSDAKEAFNKARAGYIKNQSGKVVKSYKTK